MVVCAEQVPKFMQYTTFRQYFSKFGEIGRIFMQPEDASVYKRRVARGGSQKKNFSTAWLEFADAQVAKKVVQVLNGNKVGGKHKFWHDDVWHLRYLEDFEWRHLHERQVYLKAVRSDMFKNKYNQLKKMSQFYTERVEEKRARTRKQLKKAAAIDDSECDASSGSSPDGSSCPTGTTIDADDDGDKHSGQVQIEVLGEDFDEQCGDDAISEKLLDLLAA